MRIAGPPSIRQQTANWFTYDERLFDVCAACRLSLSPRKVGSLNYISGDVTYALRGEAGEPGVSDPLAWSEADFNQPVGEDMSLEAVVLIPN